MSVSIAVLGQVWIWHLWDDMSLLAGPADSRGGTNVLYGTVAALLAWCRRPAPAEEHALKCSAPGRQMGSPD